MKRLATSAVGAVGGYFYRRQRTVTTVYVMSAGVNVATNRIIDLFHNAPFEPIMSKVIVFTIDSKRKM